MKTTIISTIFVLFTLALRAQNILISNLNNPNEASITMDPKKPGVLIAGTNIDNYHISIDTGRTWKNKTLNSSYGVWGDPTLIVDTNGNFYFFHLSNPPLGTWIDRIVCQKSIDSGKTWSDGSFTGLNSLKKQDKQWSVVDRKTNIIYVTWTQFDRYGNTGPLDSSIILFSKSIDGGTTWSNPMRINTVAGDCHDDDNTVEGATPAIGVNGEVYVTWAGPSGLVFNKSLNKGITWLNKETFIDSIPGGWDYRISGINRSNGLPITACDLSNGPNRGAIYINWSDQRSGSSNTEVWLRKSIDGGVTWLPRKKVNNDIGNHQQFCTWMTIDQTNGFLYFIFYDRRHHNDDSTDVYIAISKDGGNSFINQKISETPFLPDSNIFFGDYINIVANNGVIRPIWTRLNGGNLSLWTALLSENKLNGVNEIGLKSNIDLSFENYPNPSNKRIFISYKLHTRAVVELFIYNDKGKITSKIIDNVETESGKYIEQIDTQALGLSAGIYYLTLKVNGEIQTRRQIILN